MQIPLIFPILALLLAPDDIDGDYRKLEERTAAMMQLHAQVRKAPEPERKALQQKANEAREGCLQGYLEFCANHCGGALSERAAEYLRKALGDRAMAPLLTTYVRWALEHVSPKEFLGACQKIDPQEKQSFLDLPRAVALYAAGEEREAYLLADERYGALGNRGLFLLDVLAAIHAGRGEYEEARKLFEEYANDYGVKDDPRAHHYLSKVRWLGREAPALQIDAWLAPGGEPCAKPPVKPDLKGAVLVLDFWQSWCRSCRDMMPHLTRLQRARGGRPFQVIGLCFDDASPNAAVPNPMPGFDPATEKLLPPAEIAGERFVPHVAQFVRGMELGYCVGVASEPVNYTAYGIRTLPTLFVVDAEGRIAWMFSGTGLGVHLLVETLTARMLERLEKERKDG